MSATRAPEYAPCAAVLSAARRDGVPVPLPAADGREVPDRRGAPDGLPPAGMPLCRSGSPPCGGPEVLRCPADGVFCTAVRVTTDAMLRRAMAVSALGEARTQRVPGKRRVQTDAQDNAVHLLCHTNDADYEHRPRDDRRAVRVCGERGQHQLDEHQIEHHEYAHAGEHPQPAAEDIARAFRPAHRKGQRRTVRQDTEDNVPLRDLEEQPDKLPLDDDVYHDDDEPARVGERIKGFLPERVRR